MMSIRTTSTSGLAFRISMALLPVSADAHTISCRSRIVIIAKMLRMSSSTMSAFFEASTVQALDHLALRVRQIGYRAMQVKGRLVEQALRRAHMLEHVGLREPVDLRLSPAVELVRRVQHDRDIGHLGVFQTIDELEPRHV